MEYDFVLSESRLLHIMKILHTMTVFLSTASSGIWINHDQPTPDPTTSLCDGRLPD